MEYIEEFTLCVLGDDAELAVRLDGVEHEDDVLVFERAQDANLFTKILEILV